MVYIEGTYINVICFEEATEKLVQKARLGFPDTYKEFFCCLLPIPRRWHVSPVPSLKSKNFDRFDMNLLLKSHLIDILFWKSG